MYTYIYIYYTHTCVCTCVCVHMVPHENRTNRRSYNCIYTVALYSCTHAHTPEAHHLPHEVHCSELTWGFCFPSPRVSQPW